MTHFDDIHEFHRDTLIKQNATLLGDTALLEFGVCRGTSMLMWYDLYARNGLTRDFFGFDSFVGLPVETEDKNTIWKEGEFGVNGVINPNLLNKPDITIVSGFYSESLTDDSAQQLSGVKVGLVHMDCDTYSSTKTVWEWLLKHNLLAKGALIVYDDWGAWRQAGCAEYDIGEAKAHQEIVEGHGITLTHVHTYVLDPAFYEVKIFRYE